MVIIIIILCLILGLGCLFISDIVDKYYDLSIGLGFSLLVITFIVFIFGCFNGFINYPPTQGTHQGIITAVDLEGIYFRRYEVYLKSSGYTDQSDETKYLIYESEKELSEKLINCIGKKVKLHYGHDGGYIPWNSCGTYHIKSVELIEE